MAVPLVSFRRLARTRAARPRYAGCSLKCSPLLLGMLALVLSSGARAQAQDFGYVEANALPAPGTVGAFSSLQPAESAAPGQLHVGLRTTLLIKPLSASLPSPSPSGTDSAVVSESVQEELLLGVGLGRGVDVAASWPLTLAQRGAGLSALGVGGRVDGAALGDPRLTAGWSMPIPSGHARLFTTVFLPLGEERALAGERQVRADAGATVQFTVGKYTLGGELAFRLRETSELALMRWGPQLLLGLAAKRTLGEQFETALELWLMPTLHGQPASVGESAGYFLPSEALLSVRYKPGPLELGLLGGTGLPFTVPASDSSALGLRRGPTSPTLRISLDLRKVF